MRLTANLAERTITGLMLPFGEVGRTNLGGVTASAEHVPEFSSPITLNLEHDPARPLGMLAGLPEVTDAGIVGTFRVAETTAGSDLLAEVAAGLRTGLSVELADPVIRAGRLIGGVLTACAAVVAPAFDSARVLTAADVGDLPEDFPTWQLPGSSTSTSEETTVVDGRTFKVTTTTATDTTVEEITDTPSEEDTMTTTIEDIPSEEDTMTTTIEDIPAERLAATAAPGSFAQTRIRPGPIRSAGALFASLAQAHATGDRQMLAALDQTIYSDAQATTPPQWTGEIWNHRSHVQKYLPLFRKEALTGLKITGWEFDVRSSGTQPRPLATPTVGDYAGFPAEPTSTEVKTKAVDITAQRWAGANAFDRALIDFSHEGFWAGYYRELADDLSRKLDAAALAEMLGAGKSTAVTAATVPTDVATALSYILDGVLAIQDVAVPDFAVVGIDLYRELALTKRNDAVEYLSVAVGLDPNEGRLDQFKIVPSTDAALTGKVLVGASQAHTFYGEKTVRVDTVSISTGGVEHGLFTYGAFHTKSAKAFALVASA